MSWIPKPQEIYKHFKGNLYQIITLAKDSEDGKAMVVYQALYGEYTVYVRPLDMFVSKVDKAKYPEVTQEYRFELQMPGNMIKADQEQPKIESAAPAAADNGTVPEFKETVVSAAAETVQSKEVMNEEEEITLDPLVWEFLDADSHEQRLNILSALHHKITDQMITTMAIACDVEVPDGDVEERYHQLRNCLIMLDRFEIKRK